jgi:signal transduction histidine kinase
MQKRAREIHGELVFDTQPGSGTKVALRLPLEQNRLS